MAPPQLLHKTRWTPARVIERLDQFLSEAEGHKAAPPPPKPEPRRAPPKTAGESEGLRCLRSEIVRMNERARVQERSHLAALAAKDITLQRERERSAVFQDSLRLARVQLEKHERTLAVELRSAVTALRQLPEAATAEDAAALKVDNRRYKDQVRAAVSKLRLQRDQAIARVRVMEARCRELQERTVDEKDLPVSHQLRDREVAVLREELRELHMKHADERDAERTSAKVAQERARDALATVQANYDRVEHENEGLQLRLAEAQGTVRVLRDELIRLREDSRAARAALDNHEDAQSSDELVKLRAELEAARRQHAESREAAKLLTLPRPGADEEEASFGTEMASSVQRRCDRETQTAVLLREDSRAARAALDNHEDAQSSDELVKLRAELEAARRQHAESREAAKLLTLPRPGADEEEASFGTEMASSVQRRCDRETQTAVLPYPTPQVQCSSTVVQDEEAQNLRAEVESVKAELSTLRDEYQLRTEELRSANATVRSLHEAHERSKRMANVSASPTMLAPPPSHLRSHGGSTDGSKRLRKSSRSSKSFSARRKRSAKLFGISLSHKSSLDAALIDDRSTSLSHEEGEFL